MKLKFLKNYKLSKIAFPTRQKTWSTESHALTHVEPMPEPKPVPTSSSEPVGASEPYLYPAIFRHQAHEHSYSVKLRTILDCENRDVLCTVCPGGRSYIRDVEYALLVVKEQDALFECRNVERCNEFLVKVIFQ